MRISRVFAVLAGCVVLGAAPAMAKDFCVKEGTATLFVVRGWNLPGAGKCKPVTGTGANGGVLYGAVCRSASGTILRWGVSLQNQGGIFTASNSKHFNMGMGYPDFAGSGTVLTMASDSTTVAAATFDAQGSECTASPIP